MEPRAIHYYGNQTIDNSELVDKKISEVTSALNDTVQGRIDELVAETESLQEQIDTNKTELQEQIDTNKTELQEQIDTNKTELQEQIDELSDTLEHTKTEHVPVGSIMFWPVSEIETRETVSDTPFEFTVHDETYSVEPGSHVITLKISKDYPENWYPMNGKAELSADEYPELAKFMPNNITKDNLIWLPYLQQTIIKVK